MALPESSSADACTHCTASSIGCAVDALVLALAYWVRPSRPNQRHEMAGGERKRQSTTNVHAVRWRRVSHVDEYDWKELWQVETCGSTVQ